MKVKPRKYNSLFLLLICTISSLSCHISEPINYDAEVKALTSPELHKAYLEEILASDQAIREQQSSLIDMKKVDEDNLLKVEAYLREHAYPSAALLGKKAAIVPWLVIHHQASKGSNVSLREKYFPLLYQAYLDGNLDDGNISFYLGRMHSIKFGKRFDMPSPYLPEDELDTLIKLLNLTVGDK